MSTETTSYDNLFAGDFPVVTGKQDLGNLKVPENRRPGILRVFQQAGGMGIVFGRFFRAKDSGYEPCHCVCNDHCGRLPAA